MQYLLVNLQRSAKETNHVAGEAILVVVECYGLNELLVASSVYYGLSWIEYATVGVADNIGRHDAVLIVAVVLSGRRMLSLNAALIPSAVTFSQELEW